MTRLLSTAPAAASASGAAGSGFALAAALCSCTLRPATRAALRGGRPSSATQQPAGHAARSGTDVSVTTIKKSVNEVNLIFTVTEKHGRYIPNLQLHDFALLDDQKAPQKVNSFHQQINLPLRVGIVIDTSTSIHSRFKFEQQAARNFCCRC